ncbi:penicillin-binding protein [Candidatus Saccharibacteria bacterium]|nr:penicillin-binding protein [Candidatus Saccharibacteria bacterium]
MNKVDKTIDKSGEKREKKKADKKPKKSITAKVGASKKMNVYSSLVYKKRARKDARERKKAEDLATLPKQPVKRFFAHLHPKRVFKYWFSMRGLKMFLKILLALFLIGIIAIGGLFLYYKKDLDAIRLDEMKVSETVNVYLDRNGEVLWEDKGDGDYRLVADGDKIASYMRQATVAIEDKNFYNHPGVDLWALVRAAFSTVTGQGVQGGSTLTQQLIKQVYFSDEAGDRTVSGIPRKIKEFILALEVEKMYDKEQIITMYLNESPYGGRRNGVESGAQAYFGKSAADLTLAEAALLASIPNNPAVLNPYNEYGNEALLARQHKTLDVMVEMGYITQEQADEAKAVPILDQILPETSQYKDIKAPHFVLEVRKQLEEKYGVKTMRAGGFTITTTLDYRAQKMAEAAVATGAGMMSQNGSDNIALSAVDVETAQVIAMVGSSNWEAPVYGEVNAATSPLEPGSSIKPLLDYTPLFKQREGQNYGPGSVLRDENIDKLYCSGYVGSCQLRNYTGSFYGNVTIRQSLANSLNIPAVKALYINGVTDSLETLHNLGDWTYCSERDDAGLSIAIGSGCNVRQVEHANAYASIARGGVYKPLSYVLELKNSSGDVIESWADEQGNQVVDPQVAYLIADILGDAGARSMVFGAQGQSFGFVVPGVWTASKTGTTTTSNSAVTKDSWIMSFSPVMAVGVWNGNHDGSGLWSSSNNLVRRVMNDFMYDVHHNLYGPEGKWTTNQKLVQPAGIQKLTVNGKSDIWPSWYNSKTSGVEKVNLTFNKYTKKLAADCTQASFRIELEATKMVDPISKQEVWNVPEGYNREETDDCSYAPPSVSLEQFGKKLTIEITPGSEKLGTYALIVDGVTKESGSITSTKIDLEYEVTGSEKEIKATISDAAGYTASDSV